MGASLTATASWPFAIYFFRPYLGLVTLAVVFMLASAGLEALMIGLFLPLLGEVLGATSSMASGVAVRWLDQVVDLVPVQGRLARATMALMLVGVAVEAGRFGTTAVTAHLSTKARCVVTNRVYAHLLDADVRRVVQTPQGEWLHRAVMAPFQMTTLWTLSPLMVVQVLRVIAVLVLLVSISATLTVVGIALGLSFYAFTSYLGHRHLFTLGADQVRASEVQTSVANDGIAGIREVKAYNSAAWLMQKFQAATEAYTTQAVRQTVLQHAAPNALGVVFVALMCGAIVLAQSLAGAAYASWVPMMTVFVAGLGRVSTELASLGKYRMQIAGMLPFAHVVRAELQTPNPAWAGTAQLSGPPLSIECKNVSYAHPGRASTLSGVSFRAIRGQRTAIVGASGSGKSTLVDLLLGLYDPDEGAILIDGLDLKSLDRTSWHAQIGYVGQAAFLFHASIHDNIAIGRNIPAVDLERAARSAQVNEFVATCGAGFETTIGDRGGKLSGGQRQRLALARALAVSLPVLIVDEGTSNLESETEQAIIEALTQGSARSFLFIVSHRLATVRGADQIVVLDQGRVAEIGTHESLLRNQGVYFRLWQAQKLT